MDKEKIQRAVRDILEAIGEDPDREGLRETPRRVADMYGEIFAGLSEDPKTCLKFFHEEGSDEIVLVKDIPLYSMCEGCRGLEPRLCAALGRKSRVFVLFTHRRKSDFCLLFRTTNPKSKKRIFEREILITEICE